MHVTTLNSILPIAEMGQFAVGSFSPRYTPLIRPVLRAGIKVDSPIIIQISQRELIRYCISPSEFADEFYAAWHADKPAIPVVLHLDHAKEFNVIKDAIAARFTSVMIDASDKPLAENIALSRAVVEYAHARGVSVEAELGRIGRADGQGDTAPLNGKGLTDPLEARWFVDGTHVDALAVSVGTAHGVYLTAQPHIDCARIQAIRALTPVPLVLHGGSGVPAEMVHRAYRMPGGGVSKVNIATDLELAFLKALGRNEWMLNQECKHLSKRQLERGQAAVEQAVIDKITHYLDSEGRAADYSMANLPAAAE